MITFPFSYVYKYSDNKEQTYGYPVQFRKPILFNITSLSNLVYYQTSRDHGLSEFSEIKECQIQYQSSIKKQFIQLCKVHLVTM